MKFILSTMTSAVSYAFFTHAGDLPVIRAKVTIKGGANLPSANSGNGEKGEDGEGFPIWTADGIVTPITDEQYDRLKDHQLFKKHLDKGLVKVLDKDISHNHKAIQSAVRDMTQRDDFAQLTPDTIKQHSRVSKISTHSIEADIAFSK